MLACSSHARRLIDELASNPPRAQAPGEFAGEVVHRQGLAHPWGVGGGGFGGGGVGVGGGGGSGLGGSRH